MIGLVLAAAIDTTVLDLPSISYTLPKWSAVDCGEPLVGVPADIGRVIVYMGNLSLPPGHPRYHLLQPAFAFTVRPPHLYDGRHMRTVITPRFGVRGDSMQVVIAVRDKRGNWTPRSCEAKLFFRIPKP